MKERRRIIALTILYCIMIAITHGYVMDRSDCYINPPKYNRMICNGGPALKATIWPVYWVYHAGTLLFEPSNTDN